MEPSESQPAAMPSAEALVREMVELRDALTKLSLVMGDLMYEVERLAPSEPLASDVARLLKEAARPDLQ